jgi:hypothetical protein
MDQAIPAKTISEIERIKSKMRASSSYGDLMRVCDHERENLREIAKRGPDEHVLALHVSNLKSYLMARFRDQERAQ